MNTMQTDLYYTGFGDPGTVKFGELDQPAEDYAKLLQGQKRQTVTAPKVKEPLTVFQAANTDGSIKETYFVQGQYYFTKFDHTFRPISDLSPVFGGVTVLSITFGGYLPSKADNKMVYMAGVNGSLFVTDPNYAFKNIGSLDTYFKDYLFVYSEDAAMATGFRTDGFQKMFTYTFDAQHKLKIKSTEDFPQSAEHFFLQPTGCMRNLSAYLTLTDTTFVNRNYGYILDPAGNNDVRWDAGTLYTSGKPTHSIGTGQILHYSVNQPAEPGKILLASSMEEYLDDCKETTTFTYNSKFQISRSSYSHYTLNQRQKSFTLQQTVEKATKYLWESSQPAAAAAQKTAVGLICETSEKVTQGSVSRFSEKTRKTYTTRTPSTGSTKIYYIKTEKMDGLSGDQWVQTHHVTYLTDFGQPSLEQGGYAAGMPAALTNKRLFAEGSYLHIAEFSNIHVSSSLQSVHYLGFEPYEQFQIAGGNLTCRYFGAENVELVDVSFLGTRALRFKKFDNIHITNYFNALPDVSYIFSCWRRNSSSEDWSYFTKKISGATLKKDKHIHNFNAGNEVCHVMLRESGTTAEVRIYDPQAFRLKATMDNNGVPTVIVYDRLQRQQFAYTPELIRNTGKPNEHYYKLTGKIVISPFVLSGYARFNGFNCEKTTSEGRSLFNSALEASFPEKGVMIPYTSGSLTGLGTNTLFAAGPWLTSAQTLTVHCAESKKIELLFQGNTVKLRISDRVVATSEAYIADQSAWALFLKDKIITVFVNGKLVISYVLDASCTIQSVTTAASVPANPPENGFEKILIATKADVQMSYFDYAGNLVQTQKMRGNRLLLTQNMYDRRGNLAISTKPGFYPLQTAALSTADRPLMFRSGFALMDFAEETNRGVMSGELVDFYKSAEGSRYCELEDDYKWPYTSYTHQKDTENRLISSTQPGDFGNRMQDTNRFHDLSTYASYAHRYASTQDTDYSENKKFLSFIGKTETLTASRLFDLSGNRYGAQLYGRLTSDETTSEKTQAIEAELGVFVSDKTASPSSYERFFLSGDTAFAMERSTSTANRIVFSNSPDSGQRAVLYDILGNARLSRVSGDTKIKYAKYDLLGRLTESGTAVLTGALADYINKVNNPDFPTTSDGTITPCYRCHYDLQSGNIADFGLGRLSAVEAMPSGVTTNYSYDFLGRATRVSSASSATHSTTYEYNVAGDPLKIVYPQHFGYEAEYTYNGSGMVEKIVLKKTGGSKTFPLLSNAQHDVYDQVSSYTNAQSKTVRAQNSIYQHVYQIGEAENEPKVTKDYLLHANPDLPGVIHANTNLITILTYDELQRLTHYYQLDQSQSEEIYNVRATYDYDLRGNLTSGVIDGVTYQFTYSGNRLTTVKNSAGTILNSITYAQDGLMTGYTKAKASYQLGRDDFFASKYKSIECASPAVHLDFSYDIFGNKLKETSGTSSLFYGYGGANQLEFIAKSGSYGQNTIFIYCGNQLVAEFHPDTEQAVSLMYDSMMTLRYASYTHAGTAKSEAVSYASPWGKVIGYGTKIPKVAFLYGGMQYLEVLGCYEIDGELFFPEFGLSSVPSLSQTFETPYRPFRGQPIR